MKALTIGLSVHIVTHKHVLYKLPEFAKSFFCQIFLNMH